MSSPSTDVIDPLICSYSDSTEKKLKQDTPKCSSAQASCASGQSKASGAQTTTQAVTGWTPFVSRTLTHEMISINSTPNSKIFTSLGKSTSGNCIGVPSAEYDYGNLNLTPFFTHNINMGGNPGSGSNIWSTANFTPFYDKSMHMADFFMDSPIRNSPGKVESMTPSKFNLNADWRGSTDPKLKSVLSQTKQAFSHKPKRSITQLDTPARHPTKKYEKASDVLSDDDESDGQHDRENDSHLEVEDKETMNSNNAHFVTPSKRGVLREVPASTVNKTPLNVSLNEKNKLTTPANLHPVSSPSTVIMSSAVKSPTETRPHKSIQPPSPTPKKEGTCISSEPVMGIFTENKPKPVKKAVATTDSAGYGAKKPAKNQQGGMNRFQIVFTDVHTLMNSKKKKGGNSGSSSEKLDRKLDKKKNKGRDGDFKSLGADLKRSGGGGGPHGCGKPENGSLLQVCSGNASYVGQNGVMHGGISNPGSNGNGNSAYHPASSFSMSQDFNTSMNTSREFSLLTNSTVNTSNSNMTTADHASFDMMQGGLLSTPNGKFLLDNSFTRMSPATHPHASGTGYAGIGISSTDKTTSAQNSFHADIHATKEYMPPPPKTLTLQQAAQHALQQDMSHQQVHATHGQAQHQQQLSQHHQHHHHHQHQHQHQHQQPLHQHPGSHQQQQPAVIMNMLMSTPQRENTINSASTSFIQEESSPSSRESLGFFYHNLHHYHQTQKSPNTSHLLNFSVSETSDAEADFSAQHSRPKGKSRKAARR